MTDREAKAIDALAAHLAYEDGHLWANLNTAGRLPFFRRASDYLAVVLPHLTAPDFVRPMSKER